MVNLEIPNLSNSIALVMVSSTLITAMISQIYEKVTNTKLEHDISMFEDRGSGRFTI